MKLGAKQKKFADEYILTGNATQAAINAGYSEKSARQIGNENLTKPYILEYIESQLEEHEIDVKLRQKKILDFAERVMDEKETEEHAFVVGDQMGNDVKVVRLKPKTKDRMDAAKFLSTIMSNSEKNRLQNIKLQKEIAKLEKELETDSSTEDRISHFFNKLDGAINDES